MKLSLAFSLIVASAITSSAAEVAEFGQHSLRSASADSDRSDLSSSARRRFQVLSIDDLWEQQHVQLSLLPYVDLANNEYKLTGDVPTEEGSLRLVFKFKGSDKGDMTLADLLGGWTEEKDVGVSWTVGYHEVGGQDGGYPDLVELSHALGYTLKDPAVNPICGIQKVVAPMVMTVDGKEYGGSMTVGLATSSGRKLDSPDVEQEACPMGGLWGVWDTCATTDCGYILSADPQITGTCTLGALGGGLTATGTAFGGIGGAEMGVTMSLMAQCWNEFTGTCKFQGAFWGDYCTCHSTKAPKLVCNNPGSPCQGTAGAACSNPTWTCQPIQQTTTSSTETSSTSTFSPGTTEATKLIRGQKMGTVEAEYDMLDQQGH